MSNTNSPRDQSSRSRRASSEESRVEVNGLDGIPFPGYENSLSGSATVPAIMTNDSPDSQETSSSKQTLSDKLSALPVSKSTPNTNRLLRSPTATSSNIAPNRGFRHSFDASTSLPSFSNADLDSPPLGVWNATHSLNSHFATCDSSAEHSPEKGTPRQRVSFDSGRGSLNAMQSVREALSRIGRSSDPVVTSPAHRSSAYRDSQKDPDASTRSRSPSLSRAASPLRLFHQWSSSRHKHRNTADDPFVPVNPYKFNAQFRFLCFSRPHASTAQLPGPHTQHIHTHNVPDGVGTGTPDTQTCDLCVQTTPIKNSWHNTHIFLFDTLPREVYLNVLLRLPSMYFTRVSRIFQDAEVSKPDIQRMIESCGSGSSTAYTMATTAGARPSTTDPAVAGAILDSSIPAILRSPGVGSNSEYPPGTLSPAMGVGVGSAAQVGTAAASAPNLPLLPFPDEWTPPLVSPALIRFKFSWETFIDSLLREWKTLNVVSALLLSAILTMFQIPGAASDPVTRTAALLSLICALMSLSYGCIYIVRFGTMRSMLRAARWAEEARKTDTLIWWNVWVLLAMPAVWMAWSMALFLVSVLSFVWRTGSVQDPEQRPPLGAHAALATRITVTAIFAVGILYFALIVKTLRGYGTHNNVSNPWSRRELGAGEQTPKMRARDIDAAMERRGRERQRGMSASRGHEVAPDREDRKSLGMGDLEMFKDERKDKSGLRGILGLGIMGIGVGSKERDSGIILDLEKGFGDERE